MNVGDCGLIVRLNFIFAGDYHDLAVSEEKTGDPVGGAVDIDDLPLLRNRIGGGKIPIGMPGLAQKLGPLFRRNPPVPKDLVSLREKGII